VAKLSSGSAFGEIALINDMPRMATIICLQDCHFAVLEKSEFKWILATAEEERILK